MCEAYESEYRAIVNSEARYTIHGFVSYLEKKPRKAPHAFPGEIEAWRHGYDCARVCSTNNSPILPWPVESLIVTEKGNPDYAARRDIRKQLTETGRIPAWLMAKCKQKGWVLGPEQDVDLPDKPDKLEYKQQTRYIEKAE